ncbi:MAG: dihydropteroate synthase [Prevotellaceae bacterium]|jgi:dihydropteroate synthase|nr:dihydropteroate synthase [Prevotellaceae bacterium]
MNNTSKQLKLNASLFDMAVPKVMGIVNVTPDSFFAASKSVSRKAVLNRVEQILSEGGEIVDVGGYSTRPSADFVSTEEEIRRLSEMLDAIRKEFPEVIISVDTFRSHVANHVVKNYGVAIINDVGGGTLDGLMFETIADLKVAYVLMHMRGTPQTMRQKTQYNNVVTDVFRFLEKRLAQLRLLGVNDVMIDPGFGFAKTLEQNYLILEKLSFFRELNAPLLVGVSRKSMIQELLGVDAAGALNGTTAVNMIALMGGASVLRVHDVKEAVETVKIYTQTFNCKS